MGAQGRGCGQDVGGQEGLCQMLGEGRLEKQISKSQSQLGAGGGREALGSEKELGVLFHLVFAPSPSCVTSSRILGLLWASVSPSVEWGWWARWCGECLIWIMWAGPSDGKELCVGGAERDKCLLWVFGGHLGGMSFSAGCRSCVCCAWWSLWAWHGACPEPCECGEKCGFTLPTVPTVT